MLDLLILLAKGAGAGFVIAAPVGPVGVLCVQRTLRDGRLSGLSAGAGATLADGMYGCIAAFGLSLIAAWLQAHEVMFRLIGGFFLLAMAANMLRGASQPMAEPDTVSAGLTKRRAAEGAAQIFASTFLLTMTNPITIVAFLGIFAFLGVGRAGLQAPEAAALVAGVCVGSGLWWLSLAALAGRFRSYLQAGGMRMINRLSALLLCGFGLYGMGSVIAMWIQG